MPEHFEGSSQAECGRGRVPKRDVRFHRREGTGSYYATGIKSCGSVWACPVCAARIGYRRGHELEAALEGAEARGWTVLFVTATVPHGIHHELAEVREALLESWRYLFSGAPWKRQGQRVGYRGQVKALEVTCGDWSGWHPHVHALLFLEEELEDAELEDLTTWMRARWARKVRAWWIDGRGGGRKLRARHLGRRIPEHHRPAFGEPHPVHGLQVVRGRRSAAWYVAKMGLAREVTSVVSKRGRARNLTAFELLATWADKRDGWARARWVEYCGAMTGRRSLVWTPGLCTELTGSPEADEQAELELPGEDPIAVVLEAGLWDRLTQPHRPGCLATWHGADERARRFCVPTCRAGLEPGELELSVVYVLERAPPAELEGALGNFLRSVLLTAGEDPGRMRFDSERCSFYLSDDRPLEELRGESEALALRAFGLGSHENTEAA